MRNWNDEETVWWKKCKSAFSLSGVRKHARLNFPAKERGNRMRGLLLVWEGDDAVSKDRRK